MCELKRSTPPQIRRFRFDRRSIILRHSPVYTSAIYLFSDVRGSFIGNYELGYLSLSRGKTQRTRITICQLYVISKRITREESYPVPCDFRKHFCAILHTMKHVRIIERIKSSTISCTRYILLRKWEILQFFP